MSRRSIVGVAVSTLVLLSACGTSSNKDVLCEGGDDLLILTAQMVPSATMIPCLTGYPTGWAPGGFRAETGSVTFWLDSDRAGIHAVEVELSERCDTSGATELDPDPNSGARRFEQPTTPQPELSGRRLFLFDGGCVTLRYEFETDTGSDLLEEAAATLALVPRGVLVTALKQKRDLVLCGADAPPCP